MAQGGGEYDVFVTTPAALVTAPAAFVTAIVAAALGLAVMQAYSD